VRYYFEFAQIKSSSSRRFLAAFETRKVSEDSYETTALPGRFVTGARRMASPLLQNQLRLEMVRAAVLDDRVTARLGDLLEERSIAVIRVDVDDKSTTSVIRAYIVSFSGKARENEVVPPVVRAQVNVAVETGEVFSVDVIGP